MKLHFQIQESPGAIPGMATPSACGARVFSGAEQDIAESGRSGARAVIGDDNRKSVPNASIYPLRVLAHLLIQLEDGSQWTGTGWLASPDVLIKAGHCLLDYTASAPRRAMFVRVVPASNSSANPTQYVDVALHPGKPSPFQISKAWANPAAGGGHAAADYGAIKLPQAIGNQLGWFGIGQFTDAQLAALS